MSLLPGQIMPQTVPFGKVNDDGTVTIEKNWWLLIYNLCQQTLGTGAGFPDDESQDLDIATADSAVIARELKSAEVLSLDSDLTIGPTVRSVQDALLLAMNALDPPDAASASGSITNAQLAKMPADTIKGNNTAGLATPQDLTVAQAKALLGVPSAGFPVTQQSTSYTLALADANTGIDMLAGNVTIPANAAVPIPIGSVVLIVNYTGAPLTISITTDTLFFAGTGGAGARTLAAAGVATLYKTTATNWFCWGPGVT